MKRHMALGLAASRCVFGALGLLAPIVTQRLSLLDEARDASTVAGWRFFGTRALALGAAYLTADDDTRRHLDRAGLVVDTLDTTFLAAMAARGRLRPSSAAWLALITASAAAIGVANVTAADDESVTGRTGAAAGRETRGGTG